ncbi:unnamed protein product [Effrenium voratum]|uniref:Tyrosine-protein kinase ephrin type A/B receptor-like domain-containing protein n=1 Tax=Effrenium voratum TaxID=2562239 RepID=A0AA36JNC1_9DINO|nr:unnamed protein product [Effrenium voratum]
MEKDPVTQLADINISLGGSNFFPQLKEVTEETVMTSNIEGQGLSLPVKMKMSGVDFDMEYKMSFTTPVVVITKISPTLTAGEVSRYLNTALTNVPTTEYVTAQITSPADFVRLSVRMVSLRDVQAAPGFCERQIFSEGWTKLACVVQAAPLSAANLVVEMQIKNFSSTLWQLSGYELLSQITWQAPQITSLFTRDANGVKVDSLSVETVMISDPVFYIEGRNFASLTSLSLTYVTLKEYKLWLQGVDPELSFCKSIEYLSDTELKCYITSCLDARNIPNDPAVVLQIGDLRSTELQRKLTLPQPAISTITPELIYDAGFSEIEIQGISFSEYLASNGSFEDACTEWQKKLQGLLAGSTGRRLAGAWDLNGIDPIDLDPWNLQPRQLATASTIPALQMLGSVSVVVGDATCNVLVQNNSYVKCAMSAPRRAARKEPEEGELRGQIISENVDVSVVLKVGSIPEKNAPVLPTKLAECENEGYYRPNEDSDACEACPKGTYSTRFTTEWPLGCTFCASDSYQDQVGMTACTACPANTESVPPAAGLQDCRCKKGYYSPVYDDSQTYGQPGFACVSCSSETFTLDKNLDDAPCDLSNLRDLCDEPVSPTCVRKSPGSTTFRLCTIYCAGGTMLPLSKPYFYISKSQAVATVTNKDQKEGTSRWSTHAHPSMPA